MLTYIQIIEENSDKNYVYYYKNFSVFNHKVRS